MELPGGLLQDGRLRRDFRFRTLTGGLERALAESGQSGGTLPQQVTSLLISSLLEVGGQPVDAGLVRALCAGDRQFLIQQLDALLDASPRWITVRCASCVEPIQFQIQPGRLPQKPAGQGFPETTLQLSLGGVALRVPCGADEEFISSESGDEDELLDAMLARLLRIDGRPVDIAGLTEDDRERLDQALDEMSPQTALVASIECPHCGQRQEAEIDPYSRILRETGDLDEEIHLLAFHYHWSEKEILGLPRKRRARYLELIDRSLGRYRADQPMQSKWGE